MTSRRPLIAANWKMHPAPEGALHHDSPYQSHASVDVVVFPSFLDIPACVAAGMLTGGQCGRPEPHGARTGDISMAMLARARCRYVLCGHSERRQGYGETDADVAAQVIAALAVNIHPVICIGETGEQRTSGATHNVLQKQLSALPLTSDLTIAYEPIWAIGTGKNATAQQAQETHAFIRQHLPAERREMTRILYGGSVKASNAAELLACPDIDGVLVGGASLNPEEFRAIVSAAASR